MRQERERETDRQTDIQEPSAKRLSTDHPKKGKTKTTESRMGCPSIEKEGKRNVVRNDYRELT